MAIQLRNKRSTEFSTSSMSDIVFLLLIFFMLTSTLVSPNAIKLLLPSSTSEKTLAPESITIYINAENQFFLEQNLMDISELEEAIALELLGVQEGSVILRADQTVDVQYVVNVIDAVNAVNEQYGTLHKVILATKPSE
jgi:biopolymer transport protein ExbD